MLSAFRRRPWWHHVRVTARRRPPWAYANLLVAWACGLGAVAGALGGGFVGYLYGLDDAVTSSEVAIDAVAGLLLGTAVGAGSGLLPAALLVALQSRTWATTPVRVVFAALLAAAPLSVLQLLASGSTVVPEALGFCALVTGAPAAVAAVVASRRSATSSAGGRTDARPASG
jgi:hypothetical protein